MENFDLRKYLAEGRLFEENSFTAKEISRGKASNAQSNDISDYQFGVKVVPRKSYRDEEEVKNNVMTVKKIDDNPQNPRSIIATLLSDEKVEKQYEPADLYLYKEGKDGTLGLNEAEDFKVGETYTASMPTSSDGKERIDVKVKFLGKDRSDDNTFIVTPLEDKDYTNPVSKQLNRFLKGRQYNTEAEYLKSM
jgi:hypothetical protein